MEEKKVIQSVEIPLIWGDLDQFPSIYVNQMVITHAGNSEFYIAFGEIQLPILLGLSGEKQPTELRVKPVAKFVMTPESMLKFSEVINLNIKKYLSLQEQLKEE